MRKKQEPVDRFPMEDIENHKIVRILKTKRILAILFYDEAVTDRFLIFCGKAQFAKVSFDADGKTMI